MNNEHRNVSRRYSQIAAALMMVSVSTLLGYAVLEGAYRVYCYNALKVSLDDNFHIQVASNLGSDVNYIPDLYVGYRYPANVERFRGHPWFSTWHTNSHGHVSTQEYTVAKPSGEYRIAVLGDSFTATINNNALWTEGLQNQLNSSPAWRSHTNGKFTRVINFGVDGQGFQSFGAMSDHVVPPFNPDLVLINFISDDILRRLYYPNGINRPKDVSENEAVAHITDATLKSISWFGLHPHLLHAAAPRLFIQPAPLPFHITAAQFLAAQQRFGTTPEGVEASAQAVMTITKRFPNAIFIRSPLRGQLDGGPTQWDGLEALVADRVPGWTFVDLKQRFLRDYKPGISAEYAKKNLSAVEIFNLPKDSEKPDVFRWFFYPYDDHYTDYGSAKLGAYIGEYLIEWLAGAPVEPN